MMAHWQGWVAGVAGLLTFLGTWVPALANVNWLWGLVAVVFGVWAAFGK